MLKDVAPSQYSELLDVQLESIRGLDHIYSQEEIDIWVGYLERATSKRFAEFQNKAWVSGQGNIEGFVSWTEDQSLGTAAVECLYVRRALRGQNIGSLLLREAEGSLAFNTQITVRSTLNARAFYEKNGYTFKERGTSRAGFGIAILEKTT